MIVLESHQHINVCHDGFWLMISSQHHKILSCQCKSLCVCFSLKRRYHLKCCVQVGTALPSYLEGQVQLLA